MQTCPHICYSVIVKNAVSESYFDMCNDGKKGIIYTKTGQS